MTQSDYDKALKTITEALDHWVKTAVSRKTHSMLMAERDQAIAAFHVLLSYRTDFESKKF